jgi:hypothetical protein
MPNLDGAVNPFGNRAFERVSPLVASKWLNVPPALKTPGYRAG